MSTIVDELKKKISDAGGDASGIQTIAEGVKKLDLNGGEGGGGGTSELPAVTTDDNGKFLGVVEGAWGKVAPPAFTGLFLIHTSSDFQDYWVFDKTWTEIYNAGSNGALIFVLMAEDGDEEHVFVPDYFKVMNIEVMHPEGSDDPLYSVSIKMPDPEALPDGYIEVFFVTDDPDGYPSWDGSIE